MVLERFRSRKQTIDVQLVASEKNLEIGEAPDRIFTHRLVADLMNLAVGYRKPVQVSFYLCMNVPNLFDDLAIWGQRAKRF